MSEKIDRITVKHFQSLLKKYQESKVVVLYVIMLIAEDVHSKKQVLDSINWTKDVN